MKKVKTIPTFSDFPINKISALLLNMKLKGVVRHLLGKLFEAVQLQCYQQPYLENVNNRQKIKLLNILNKLINKNALLIKKKILLSKNY